MVALNGHVDRLHPHGVAAAAGRLVALALALSLSELPACRGAVTQVTTKCEEARDATLTCLLKESSRLHELAAKDEQGRWFTNANSSAGLVSFFCSEYEKSSACLCHVHRKCNRSEAEAIMAMRAAHFGVYGDLCRHRNLSGEFAQRARCYGKAERVFKKCFGQCWANRTCASCNESMDCTTQILGASCQRDGEFERVLRLLIRVKERFMDASGCFSDSSAPLNQSFRAHSPPPMCSSDSATRSDGSTTHLDDTLMTSQRGLQGGLTSGGGGGGHLVVRPAAGAPLLPAAFAAVAALTLGLGRPRASV